MPAKKEPSCSRVATRRSPRATAMRPCRPSSRPCRSWKHDVGRHLDDLIGEEVPDVRKAVRWNSPFYGTEGGWFPSYHCFDKYVKVTFLNGASLDPLPPESSKDPDTRYLHIREEVVDDEPQLRDWIRQAAAAPGWDGFQTED